MRWPEPEPGMPCSTCIGIACCPLLYIVSYLRPLPCSPPLPKCCTIHFQPCHTMGAVWSPVTCPGQAPDLPHKHMLHGWRGQTLCAEAQPGGGGGEWGAPWGVPSPTWISGGSRGSWPCNGLCLGGNLAGGAESVGSEARFGFPVVDLGGGQCSHPWERPCMGTYTHPQTCACQAGGGHQAMQGGGAPHPYNVPELQTPKP